MSGTGETPERIDKLMGLTAGEFAHSIAGLAPESYEDEGRTARIAIGDGQATVRFAALPPAVLGGLVRMPRANVTLTFEGVGAADRAAFLRRFDVVFQRGGG